MKGKLLVAFSLVAVTACATSSQPDLPAPDPLGTWAYEGLVGTSVYGEITFLPDDWVEIRCDGSRRQVQPRRRETRLGRVHFRGCGLEFQVRDGGDGRLIASVLGRKEENYSAQGPCVAWATRGDGSRGPCMRYDAEIRTRSVEVRVELELRPIT